MSGMTGGNQGMPMMNQFMPGYFPPMDFPQMDPNNMYGMGMPNQGKEIINKFQISEIKWI